MLKQPVRFREVEADGAFNAARMLAALRKADLVVAMTPFEHAAALDYAHVMLPVGPFTETAGTFINMEGTVQSFTGCVQPLGETRPAWKVLRVLGNLLGLAGFDYPSAEAVREELKARLGSAAGAAAATDYRGRWRLAGPRGQLDSSASSGPWRACHLLLDHLTT